MSGLLRAIGVLGLMSAWALTVNGALAEPVTGQSTGEIGTQVLDLEHPYCSQRLEERDPGTFDFVRLIVAKVNNPKRVGLIFEVAFIPDGGKQVQLGGFSLYPPDRPGEFIVSTRHLINSSGVVVVTLHTAAAVDSGTALSVTMGAIGLAHGRT